MQVEAMPKTQPVTQDLPAPEWVTEIQRLRAEVANYKARARPVRDSVEAAQNVRAKAEKRSAGLMDDMPTNEQLKLWLEDKNLEMRDALDVGDAEGDLFVGTIDCEGRQAVGSVLSTGNFRRRIPDLDRLLERVDLHLVEIGENTQVCRQVWAPTHTGGGSCSSGATSSIETKG